VSPEPAIAPPCGGRRGLLLAAAALVATGVLAAFVASRWRGAQTPPINGEWVAPVAYSWGERATERFRLRTDRDVVAGTASFLGFPRGILDGRLDGDRVTFRTRIEAGPGSPEFSNGYRGQIDRDQIASSSRTTAAHRPSSSPRAAPRATDRVRIQKSRRAAARVAAALDRKQGTLPAESVDALRQDAVITERSRRARRARRTA
jgi:hypothetical protein